MFQSGMALLKDGLTINDVTQCGLSRLPTLICHIYETSMFC